jgi:hypothetical protein
MKKLLTALIGVSVTIALAFAIAGCTTTTKITNNPDGTSVTNTVTHLDPQRTSTVIKAIIPPAVVLAVNQEPATRQYLEKAQIAVCAAASAGKFSPDELRAAIDATGVKEIQTPEVQAAIQSIYGIYEAYYGDVVAAKLNGNEWLVPVLTAICDGLRDGLAASPAAPVIVTPVK